MANVHPSNLSVSGFMALVCHSLARPWASDLLKGAEVSLVAMALQA